MATKSILKTVRIKNSNLCRSFADAIEKTQHTQKPDVKYERKCTDLKKEKIKEFFDNF